jgi:hypothetical protein
MRTLLVSWPTALESRMPGADRCPESVKGGLARPPTDSPDDTAPSELLTPLASWRRHRAAQRMSPAAPVTRRAAVRLVAFLAPSGMPRSVGAIRPEHVEAFITHLLERCGGRVRSAKASGNSSPTAAARS